MKKMSKEEVLKAIESILNQYCVGDETVELSTLSIGDTFQNGRFVVLDHREGVTAVRDLMERPERVFDEETPDWKESELRTYLNTDVLKEYEELFGDENIVVTETDLTTLDGQTEYGICTDKVRLLTFEERRKYQGFYNHSGEWEWTVTPWSTKERGIDYIVCVVSPRGHVDYRNCYFRCAVRPFCIFESSIFESIEDEDDDWDF